MRINKQINDLNIVNEIKSETKDLYEQSFSNNNYSYNNDINNKDENRKQNFGNIWNIGKNNEKDDDQNAIINDFWNYKYNNDIKNKNKPNNKYDKDDSNENQESEEDENNNDIIYDKPEKYNKIEIIFCEDLNGWSKPKKLD